MLSDTSLGWRALNSPTSETPDSVVTWPRSRFNTSDPGLHKGDKPEPELDQLIELDDSRDKPAKAWNWRRLLRKIWNQTYKSNKQEEQEQRNTKPEPKPEPKIETPIPTTGQGKWSTKRVNYSLLHIGKKNPKTPNNKELKETIDDLKKQLKEAKKTNKQNDKALTLKDKIINNLEEKLEIKDQQIYHLNQDINQSKQEEETLSTQND